MRADGQGARIPGRVIAAALASVPRRNRRQPPLETKHEGGSLLAAQAVRHLKHRTSLQRLRAIGDLTICGERLATTARALPRPPPRGNSRRPRSVGGAAVDWALDGAVHWALDGAVHWALNGALPQTVQSDSASNRAMSRGMSRALWRGCAGHSHPFLGPFRAFPRGFAPHRHFAGQARGRLKMSGASSSSHPLGTTRWSHSSRSLSGRRGMRCERHISAG